MLIISLKMQKLFLDEKLHKKLTFLINIIAQKVKNNQILVFIVRFMRCHMVDGSFEN